MTPIAMESTKDNAGQASAAETASGRNALETAKRYARLFDASGYQKAARCLRDHLVRFQCDGAAHASLAEVFSLWGFRVAAEGRDLVAYFERAYQHASLALEYAPDEASSHRAMSAALRYGPKADPARRKESIEKALQLDSSSAENWYEFWRASGYSPSDPAILRAIKLDPGLVGAFIDLGFALCKHGRLEEAERYLRHAIKLAPENALAIYNLAMVLDRKGARREAIDVIQKALKTLSSDVLLKRGLAYLGERNNEASTII